VPNLRSRAEALGVLESRAQTVWTIYIETARAAGKEPDAAAARRKALGLWRAAITALEAGDAALARASIELARELSSQWGAPAIEELALILLGGQAADKRG
jgi:hypothetical protein